MLRQGVIVLTEGIKYGQKIKNQSNFNYILQYYDIEGSAN